MVARVKLARPALLFVVIASLLAGCSASAVSTPRPSAASTGSGTPEVRPTPAFVDGLPTSCEAFFSGLTSFVSPDGSLVLDPGWKSAPGVPRQETSGYGTYDPTLAALLSTNPGLICDWAPPTGPTDTFLTTQVRHIDSATQQTALARMTELGWSCNEFYGGQWCLTNDSHTGRSIGESQFLGHGVWLASDWNDAGPDTYTPELVKILFG